MKISYAITVCNEHKEIEKLLTFLFEHKRPEDQVVVQMDMNATPEVINVCEKFENKPHNEYTLKQFALNKNFAAYKNNLNKNCIQSLIVNNIDLLNENFKNLSIFTFDYLNQMIPKNFIEIWSYGKFWFIS